MGQSAQRAAPAHRAPAGPLKEAHALASVCYEHIIARFADNPGQQTFWRTDLAETLFAPTRFLGEAQLHERPSTSDPDLADKSGMRCWCHSKAYELLQEH